MRCSFKTGGLYYGILKCMHRNPQLFSLDLARSDKHISRAAMKWVFFSLFVLQLISQDCPEVERAVYFSGPQTEQNHFLSFLISVLS